MTDILDLHKKISNMSIVDSIQLDTLLPLNPTSPQFQLFTDNKKQNKIEAYKVLVLKEKLIHNLQIYQWRNKTQFPIIKTKSISLEFEPKKQSQLVEVKILNQHCPIRLSEMPDLNIGQVLYLLKQSLIGYERLYNRFGGFQIHQRMIALNEKGNCKVWLNQNFSLNGFPRCVISEKNMVVSLIKIMQSHVSDSRNSRNLFKSLKTCNSFFQALKSIDAFLRKIKVLIPKKIIIPNSQNSLKVFPDFLQKFRLSRNSLKTEAPFIRFSIKSTAPKKQFDLHSYLSKTPKKSKSPRPPCIKRFKSQNRLFFPNNMKISEGQTAYSKSIRQIKTSNAGLSSLTPKSPKSRTLTPQNLSPNTPNTIANFQARWAEDSSFVMEMDEGNGPLNKKGRQKKELSHSEAFKQPHNSLKNISDRKYSVNVAIKPHKRQNKTEYKNPETEDYLSEFSSLLNREQEKYYPYEKINEEEEEQKMQLEHLNNILRNNGWNMKGLLEGECQLKNSFHAHDNNKEQPVLQEDPRLHKLGSLARRQMAMSILPEETEEMY